MSEDPRGPWRRSGTALAVLAVALTSLGCLVGPNYTRPAPPAADGYLPPKPDASAPETPAEREQRVALGAKIPAEWWALFRYPLVDETVRRVIAANYSLAAARATLAGAQEAVVIARSAFYPTVDLQAGVRRGVVLGGPVGNLFTFSPTVSYNVDVFGGTRRRVEQEQALAESQRYQLAAAYLILTGNSVTEAITIASTRFQIATVEDVIKNDQKNLDLVQRAFDAGRVAKTDVLTAAAQLESDRTQLPALYQQLSAARHALAVLVGEPTGGWTPPEFDIDAFTLPDDLPVSLPSELVRQRPDILASEAFLHADSAAIGVATAEMYPSITISTSLAQTASTLGSLFEAAARTWAVGAEVNAPIFHGGALAAQRRAAIDAYDAGLATYRETIVTAFGQVADSLTAIEHDNQMVAASRQAVDIARASVTLQRSSYASGRTSALQLIVAEDTYSNVLQGYTRAIGQRLADTAQLFIAVGGGWWSEGDGVVPGSSPPTGGAP
ncbi:MAG TPA: efflux transporter outer membrane subunit [Thermoanaerobaculia bacterium]|nr:efflux transporter outer membrane subunit [Thermoanaerobaculia bacterium]